MNTQPVAIALDASARADLINGLNAETLSSLMRSTWTWDDRALRRRLSELLTDLQAVRELRHDKVECNPLITEAAEFRALADLGEFVAEVLGPRLLTETANPFRDSLLPLVNATGELNAAADRGIEKLAKDITGQVIERNESLAQILPTQEWADAAFDGPIGLAKVAYSSGYTLGDTEYFGAAALGAQAFTIAAPPTEQRADLRRCTLAAAERTGSWDPAMVKARATATETGYTISGEKWFVPGAAHADTLFVIARTVGGPSLYEVDAAASGVAVEELPTIDPSRTLAHITFDGAPATMVGREGAGGRTMSRTVDQATTALAGEQTGLIDAALNRLCEVPPSTTDNNGWDCFTRRIAELEIDRTLATALWYRAVKYQSSDNLDAAAVAAAMAHVGCSAAVREVALRVPSINPDVDTEFVAKLGERARSTDLLLGGPALSHERLLERLGI